MRTPRAPLHSIIRLIFLAIIFTVSGTAAHAQWHDYIVTIKNDTIYGDMRSSYGIASRLKTRQSTIFIDTGRLVAYYLASSQAIYKRKTLPGRKQFAFLRCREVGGINLYEDFLRTVSIDGLTINTSITLYAEKEPGELLEVWSNSGLYGYGNKIQRVAMAVLLADNPRLRQVFDADTKYEAGDVDYYVREYNKEYHKDAAH